MPRDATVPMHLIDEPPLAMRAAMDDGALQKLAESITASGLIHAVSIREHGERYYIICGHRRYMAFTLLGRPEIKAVIYAPGEKTDEEIMLAENDNREGVSDGEMAVWLMETQERHHLTEEQLCSLVKRKPDWVADRLRLFKGDPEVLQALIRREINFSVARELNKCKGENFRRMYLHQAIESTPPARLVAQWVTQANLQGNGAEPAPMPTAPIAENVAPPAPPQGCELCGGHLDPWNLRWHLLHEHEWQRLQDAIRNGARE